MVETEIAKFMNTVPVNNEKYGSVQMLPEAAAVCVRERGRERRGEIERERGDRNEQRKSG